jgi:hypothetical protein
MATPSRSRNSKLQQATGELTPTSSIVGEIASQSSGFAETIAGVIVDCPSRCFPATVAVSETPRSFPLRNLAIQLRRHRWRRKPRKS